MTSQSRRGWITAVVVFLAVLAVGCYSLAVDYSPVTSLLEPQEGAVSNIVQLLDQGNSQEATQALDALHDAVTQARALLNGTHFTGSANMLTDPFTLPAGTYRVHLKTTGAPFVDVVPMATPQDPRELFALFGDEAVSGMSTLYVADGSRIMLQFTYVDTPYELWFEKIG